MNAYELEPGRCFICRTWMVVYGEENRFVTGRQEPKLTLIKTTIHIDALLLNAPDFPQLRLPLPMSILTIENSLTAKYVLYLYMNFLLNNLFHYLLNYNNFLAKWSSLSNSHYTH